jgi:hypothetical protein
VIGHRFAPRLKIRISTSAAAYPIAMLMLPTPK